MNFVKQWRNKPMKSYTDIEQSNKLAKMLPPESADMYYPNRVGMDNYPLLVEWKNGNKLLSQEIPCWSLAALLAVIDNTKDEVFFYDLQHDMILGWMIDVEGGGWYEETDFFDNPVDACCEMIVKLHKQKML